MAAPKAPVKAKTAGRSEPEDRKQDGRDVLRTRSGREINMSLANPDNQFDFDKSIVPPGWDYEWKTETVANAPWTQHQVNLAQSGWEAVPAERHDGMFLPLGEKGPVRRGGMLLMERPMKATQISRARDKAKADNQVASAFQRANMAVPREITDFDHSGAKKVSGFRSETQGFATQSEESYNYSVDD